MRCNYPLCNHPSSRTWALLPICLVHYETIMQETLGYYDKRIPYDERQHYLQVAPMIKVIKPYYAQKVKKHSGKKGKV